MKRVSDRFSLKGKVAVITGGAGLLGVRHAQAVASEGGIPILWDINLPLAKKHAQQLSEDYDCVCDAAVVDVTDLASVKNAYLDLIKQFSKVDILINNAANDPKPSLKNSLAWARLENFSSEMWHNDLNVGIFGAFNCSKVIGVHMAAAGGGVILNIASDLGVIAPDQRIYSISGADSRDQPVKPITYSVVKHAIIGLTKYLATYWAEENVRVNSLSPGGVFVDQPPDFIEKLSALIPLGRMADDDEYQAAVLFLVSEASSYMTGSNLIVDGGRTCW